MKRLFFFILLICFSLIIVSCATQSGVNIQIPTMDNMKYIDTETKKIEGETISAKNYNVSDESIEKFLPNFEKVLNEDGWNTTYKIEPTFLQVTKDEVELTILPLEQKAQLMVKIVIRSKINE